MRKAEEKKLGGGVAICIKNLILDYSVNESLSVTNDHIELLVVKDMCNIIAVSYRPPKGSAGAFFDVISNLLTYVTTSRKAIYLTGDFNINMLSDSHLRMPSTQLHVSM